MVLSHDLPSVRYAAGSGKIINFARYLVSRGSNDLNACGLGRQAGQAISQFLRHRVIPVVLAFVSRGHMIPAIPPQNWPVPALGEVLGVPHGSSHTRQAFLLRFAP